MENQTSLSPKGGPSKTLIIILFVVLIGGGIGAWLMLRPKPDDSSSSTGDDETLTGREDVSDLDPGPSQEEIDFLFGSNNNSFNPTTQTGGGTVQEPMYIKSTAAQDLIRAKAESLQGNTAKMDIIRAKYNVGKNLITFGAQQQQAVDSLFSKVSGVDLASNPSKRYLTFPIWGTHEIQGDVLRGELQTFLNHDAVGYNLTAFRHGGKPWWLPSVSLNLLIGTDTASTWSHTDIWWYIASRDDIDFYKRMNGLWKNDRELVDGHSGGRAWYYAGQLKTFVQRWIYSIDYLDKVTEWEAIRTLTAPVANGGNGFVFTYIDPATNTDVRSQFDPGESSTNDNLDPIL